MCHRSLRYWNYRKSTLFSAVADAAADPQATDFSQVLHFPNPENFIRRIDISHHETINDWNDIIKAGVTEVYMKVTEGVGTYDSMAATFARDAKDAGFKIGYYHFGRPDRRNTGTVTGDALAEAKDYLDTIAQLPAWDLPLALDLEEADGWKTPLSPADYLLWLKTFLPAIESPGKPMPYIYSRKSYFEPLIPANHGLGARYPLWLARYHIDARQARTIAGWNRWTAWQFSEKGILGTNQGIDLNWVRK